MKSAPTYLVSSLLTEKKVL